ncbi:hypothetical protein NQZ68_019149 [Dissostichus eleginoides]|nr:hypothetical protein NQZ68_019149 [Dissostichus eleginoides]
MAGQLESSVLMSMSRHRTMLMLMPAPTRTCPKWVASRPGRGPRKHHIRTVPSPAAPPFPQIHGQSVPLLPLCYVQPLSASQIMELSFCLPKGPWLPGSNDLRGYFVTTRV